MVVLAYRATARAFLKARSLVFGAQGFSARSLVFLKRVSCMEEPIHATDSSLKPGRHRQGNPCNCIERRHLLEPSPTPSRRTIGRLDVQMEDASSVRSGKALQHSLGDGPRLLLWEVSAPIAKDLISRKEQASARGRVHRLVLHCA
jgi:hypothetical protein